MRKDNGARPARLKKARYRLTVELGRREITIEKARALTRTWRDWTGSVEKFWTCSSTLGSLSFITREREY